jgi:hypothetical protein
VSETLEDLLTAVASEAGAESRRVGGAVEFGRAGNVFAVVSAETVDLHLDPEIAEAAFNTPGAEPSTRGGEWVHLTVQPDQPHDLDRARAWFLSAWRNAAG